MVTRLSLLQRPLVALLCAQLLVSACGATEIAPGAARWPSPAPQWPANVVTHMVPDFEAPSATHCARPVRSHESPGRIGQRDEASAGYGESRPSVSREARSPPAAPAAGAADGALIAEAEAPRFAPPAPGTPPMQRSRRQQQVVSAGMVDDNADFSAYLQFRQRTSVAHRARDVSERYLLQVRDARGAGLPDAEVAVQAANGAAMWARTDSAGRA